MKYASIISSAQLIITFVVSRNRSMFLENITQEQIQEFREAFALFDKDGDGCINNKELKTVLRSFGHNPTKEELEIYITLIDEDRSGTIDFRQFLILISQRLTQKSLVDDIVESFKVIDHDGDGYLTRLQLKGVLLRHGWKQIEQINNILDELDTDGEGYISITQYVNYMIRSEHQRQNQH